MAQKIILRKGTANDWTTADPILEIGEPGYETDTGKLKIGSGSVWSQTSYVPNDIDLSIDNLNGVSIVNPQLGQVLKYNGTLWTAQNDEINAGGANILDDLTDVTITSPSAGEILKFDGANWINDVDQTGLTYGLSAESSLNPNSALVRLTASNNTTDDLNIVGSGNVLLSRADENTIVIEGINTDNSFSGTTTVSKLNTTQIENLEAAVSLKLDSVSMCQIRPVGGTLFGSGGLNINGTTQQLIVSGSEIPAGVKNNRISEAHDIFRSSVFSFERSRGSTSAPTTVLEGDQLGGLLFIGHNGTTFVRGASIGITVDGTPGETAIPTRIDFFTSNSTSTTATARMLSDGSFRTDKISAVTENANLVILNNGTGIVELPAGTTVGGVPITGGGATTVEELSDVTITDLTNGQVLKYNGTGWVNGPDVSSLPTRSSLQASTGQIADSADADLNILGYSAYSIFKVQTSHASWIRLYTSDAARQADASRQQGVDPSPGSGVIVEVITTGDETVLISPGTFGFNDETPVTSVIPAKVTNLSGGTADITVTLTAIQLEA